MQETTKYQISQLSAAQEVELELYTNNWCSIRTTHQTTHKLRITWLIWMLETTKYQISRLSASQGARLELDINSRYSIRTTHKLRKTQFK